MKKKQSINWGKWLREPARQQRIIEEIQNVSKHSRFWAVAAMIIMALLVTVGILLNYFLGMKSSENIDAATRQMLNANQAFIQQSQTALNPNDFIFKPFEDSNWYEPTPANEYVKLNILAVQSRKLPLKFSVKNRSDFPARNVYCTLFFSSKEFVESGEEIVEALKEIDGLNAYMVNSPDDYLNQAAAFEWLSIPPKTQKTVTKNISLTMKGNAGRLTVRINTVNRLAFEFRRSGD